MLSLPNNEIPEYIETIYRILKKEFTLSDVVFFEEYLMNSSSDNPNAFPSKQQLQMCCENIVVKLKEKYQKGDLNVLERLINYSSQLTQSRRDEMGITEKVIDRWREDNNFYLTAGKNTKRITVDYNGPPSSVRPQIQKILELAQSEHYPGSNKRKQEAT